MTKVLVTIIRDNDYITVMEFTDPKYFIDGNSFVCHGKWIPKDAQVYIVMNENKETKDDKSNT